MQGVPPKTQALLVFLSVLALVLTFCEYAQAAYGPLVCQNQIENSYLVPGDKFDILVTHCTFVIGSVARCDLNLGHYVLILTNHYKINRDNLLLDMEYVGVYEPTGARIFKP